MATGLSVIKHKTRGGANRANILYILAGLFAVHQPWRYFSSGMLGTASKQINKCIFTPETVSITFSSFMSFIFISISSPVYLNRMSFCINASWNEKKKIINCDGLLFLPCHLFPSNRRLFVIKFQFCNVSKSESNCLKFSTTVYRPLLATDFYSWCSCTHVYESVRLQTLKASLTAFPRSPWEIWFTKYSIQMTGIYR